MLHIPVAGNTDLEQNLWVRWLDVRSDNDSTPIIPKVVTQMSPQQEPVPKSVRISALTNLKPIHESLPVELGPND